MVTMRVDIFLYCNECGIGVSVPLPLPIDQMTEFWYLPNWKLLQTTKLNVATKMIEFVSESIENIVDYQHFLLFPYCF